MQRSLSWFIFFLVVICGGLAVDQFFSWGQYTVDVVVWIVFAALMATSSRADRVRFLLCLLIATGGEILLSHFLQFYTYRERNIPLFVPPGHVLVYACGLWLAPRVSKRLWLAVLVPGVIFSAWCFIHHLDQFSLLLFTLWCVIICRKPLRQIVSVMFLLALGMEIVGTSLGNWSWTPHMPFLTTSFTESNPPFAVGVFYCGLDFLIAMLSGLTPGEKTSKDSYDKIDSFKEATV